MYTVHVPVLGNPQAGLVDLQIESTIRILCEFEDCGFPNKSHNWMRICGLNFNPHFLRICGLRIPQRRPRTYMYMCTCMCCTCMKYNIYMYIDLQSTYM